MKINVFVKKYINNYSENNILIKLVRLIMKKNV